MSLFDLFSPRHATAIEIMAQIRPLVVNLFLIVLAGLAFQQHGRRPGEMRLFLVAIVLTLLPLGVPWGIVRNVVHAIDPLGTTSLMHQSEFATNLLNNLIFLGTQCLIWWCLLKAAFGVRPVLSDNGGSAS